MPTYEEVMSQEQLAELREGRSVIVNIKGDPTVAEFVGSSKYPGYSTVRVDGKKVVRRVIRAFDGPVDQERHVTISSENIVESPEITEEESRAIRRAIMHSLREVRVSHGVTMHSSLSGVDGNTMTVVLHVSKNS